MSVVHYISRTGEDVTEDGYSFSDDEYLKLALETEKKAQENYAAYKSELVRFACLAYLYISLLLVLLAGVFLYSFKTWGISLEAFICVLFILLILKGCWVKMEAPRGILLEKEKYPELFSEIEEICQKLNTKADVVLLNSDFNASVIERPRAFILGSEQNYLILGLPFMMNEDTDMFKATLAHEFGHLTANHSKTTRWVYSLRKRLSQIFASVNTGSILIYPFFCWYYPRFEAKSLVMTRKHEKEADQYSVQVAGVEAGIRSLVSAQLKGRYLYREIWKDIYARAKNQKDPPCSVFAEIQSRLKEFPASKIKGWYEDALNEFDDKKSSHPVFKERIQLIDPDLVKTEIPLIRLEQIMQSQGPSAAEYYIKDNLPELIKELDSTWQKENEENWSNFHEHFEKLQLELDELIEKEKRGQLFIDEMRKKVFLLDELSYKNESYELSKLILDWEPKDAFSNFVVGARFLDEGKTEEALQNLEIASTYNLGCAIESSDLGLCLRDHNEIYLAVKERMSLKTEDILIPHDLCDSRLETLNVIADRIKSINAMYVARKQVSHFIESSHYVIGLSVNTTGNSKEYAFDTANKILKDLRCYLPTMSVFAFEESTRTYEAMLKKVPNALIFIRPPG